IRAGERKSEKVKLLFEREYLSSNYTYLFPIQAVEVETGELIDQIYYIISPVEDQKEIGEKPGTVIAYIDTEVMNPLIAAQFSLSVDFFDMSEGFEETNIYKGPLLDILNVRTAFLKEVQGHATLTYTTDMEYVLKNHSHYLRPMQENGLKVCLAIMGGGTGLGFANLTDAQISDFAAQVQTAVSLYDLDGINLWDKGAGYGKEGMAPINDTSYAKLIKALKNAMPGKLLTLVDTRETTEALCDEQAGISVGNYLDYAWSSLEDFLAPYEPDATIRPLAGIPEKKYGTIFLRDIAAMSQEEQVDLMENSIIGEYMNMMRFTPLSGTDVVVGADIPYMDYGKESVWNDPWATWILCKYPAPEDFSSSTMAQTEVPYSVRDYYMFQKDW
ncbi:glycosyl hydrolase family 18 protein, partial [Bacteroides ovatus]